MPETLLSHPAKYSLDVLLLLCAQLLQCAVPPDSLEETSSSQEMPWQAAMAELVLLVHALDAEASAAAAINAVLPADLLTGSSSSTSLSKK